MIEILWPAIAAGLGLAILSGPLGSFLIWGKMSYFGDTMAHTALLGIAIGLLLNIHLILGVIILVIITALLLSEFQGMQELSNDTILSILSHGGLALGLVLLSFTRGSRLDLSSFLFGDLLATDLTDLYWVISCMVVSLICLFWLWRPLLNLTMDADLARAEGIPVKRCRIVLLLLIAFAVAVGMKIVGVLLITAILIIPAATARQLASTPEQMALGGSLLGAIAVLSGVLASFQWDIPTGPCIVVCASLLFVGILIYSRLGTIRR